MSCHTVLISLSSEKKYSFQAMAESFCSLVHHCFQLVYTDVMIDLIEDTIDKAILRDESISISSSKY